MYWKIKEIFRDKTIVEIQNIYDWVDEWIPTKSPDLESDDDGRISTIETVVEQTIGTDEIENLYYIPMSGGYAEDTMMFHIVREYKGAELIKTTTTTMDWYDPNSKQLKIKSRMRRKLGI